MSETPRQMLVRMRTLGDGSRTILLPGDSQAIRVVLLAFDKMSSIAADAADTGSPWTGERIALEFIDAAREELDGN